MEQVVEVARDEDNTLSQTTMQEEGSFLEDLTLSNPHPIMLFDMTGRVIFENDAAKSMHLDIQSLMDICTLNAVEIERMIANNGSKTVRYRNDNRYFDIKIQGSQKRRVVFLYATDVTKEVVVQKELKYTQKEFTHTMGLIGEQRSHETVNHIKRVSEYSKLLGIASGLSKQDVKLLYLAAPLHDIGNALIPDEILNKPEKLTNEEYQIMKQHTQYGHEIFKNYEQPLFKAVATIAHQHHEKYDGSGYPQGLKGEEIHIFARIFAIADVFDALASDRVYKKAWEIDMVLDLIRSERGHHFDPKLVDLFFKHLHKFLAIKSKYQD